MLNYPPIVQVNEFGVAVSPVSYELAHPGDGKTPGIRHLTSSVFIFDDTSLSRILLTEKSYKISRINKLNVSIEGHAIWLKAENRGQTPLEAALSELSEEIFFNLSLPEEIRNTITPVTSFSKDLRSNDLEYVHMFQGVYKGPFSLNPDKVYWSCFAEIDLVKNDVGKHPELYVRSAGLYLEKLLENR
ncbi:MAG: hypothetical protein Q8N99_02720 [Nanoarchaeota archaeon]|nr:hypothetical protein [Nanoarchaeota archaeon]